MFISYVFIIKQFLQLLNIFLHFLRAMMFIMPMIYIFLYL